MQAVLIAPPGALLGSAEEAVEVRVAVVLYLALEEAKSALQLEPGMLQ